MLLSFIKGLGILILRGFFLITLFFVSFSYGKEQLIKKSARYNAWDTTKAADIEFDVSYTIDPVSGEKRALLRSRRITFGGEKGQWVYAGLDSWNEWTDDQKCKLHSVLKEYGSLLAEKYNCEKFKILFPQNINYNDYISVDHLLIGNLVGFTIALNDSSFKFDGSEIVGGDCGGSAEKLHNAVMSAKTAEIVDVFPKERYVGLSDVKKDFCVFIKWKEYREKIKQGMKAEFYSYLPSETSYFSFSLPKINFGFFIAKSFASINDEYDPFDVEIESQANFAVSEDVKDETAIIIDPLINQFELYGQQNINEKTRITAQLHNICSEKQCTSIQFAEMASSIDNCNQEIEKQFEKTKAQLEKKYENDPKKLAQAKIALQDKMSERLFESDDLQSAIKHAVTTGNSNDLNKFIEKKEKEILEAKVLAQAEQTRQQLMLDTALVKIKDKEEKGEQLTERDLEIKEIKLQHQISYVDNKTGEVTKDKIYDRREYLEMDKAVKSDSREDDFT